MNKLPIDTILKGDCRNILPGLPESSVDLVFADPPYYLQLSQDLFRPNSSKVMGVADEWDKFSDFNEYDKFSLTWLNEVKRILKPAGTLWVIGTYHNIYRLGSLIQDLGYWILNDIIWIKDNPMPNFRGVRFTNAHETMIWAQKKKGAKYTFNYHSMKSLNDDLQMRSDWYMQLCTGKERIKKNGGKVHATQKPEALLYRIILASTEPGDIILDPFFGTGTSGAVAKKLGRHFIGIEQNEEYFQIATKRIEAIQPVPAAVIDLQEPRNRTRVPFGRLLEAGFLQPGERLLFSNDHSISGTILANGKLKVGSQIGSIHSIAKSLLPGSPANGWDLWLYQTSEGLKPIDHLRNKLINNGSKHAPSKNETR